MPRLVFTRRVAGTYDPVTETETGATATTIAGEAIVKTKGAEQRYRDLSLVMVKPTTFFFTPDSYALLSSTSDFVEPGDTVEYNGLTLTVRHVSPPVGPDGKVVGANIVASVG